eukprot:5646873-Pyramimonas_sp.AAC.1
MGTGRKASMSWVPQSSARGVRRTRAPPLFTAQAKNLTLPTAPTNRESWLFRTFCGSDAHQIFSLSERCEHTA